MYGEVQKEVIRDTLAEDYGLEVLFGETVTILRERPVGTGRAGATLGEAGNRHLATLGLTVGPADDIRVDLSVPLEHMPPFIYGTVAAFREAMERYVRDAFVVGGPNGWEVIDARVIVTACGYTSPASGAGDFRRLVGDLIPQALADAGSVVCEPVQQAVIEGPADAFATVLAALSGQGGVITGSAVTGPTFKVRSLLPADRIGDLERALPGLTHGQGTLDATFAGWRPRR